MDEGNDQSTSERLEEELRHHIVEGLVLQDVEPSDIDPESPLFENGIGLDSVDALELAMIIQKEYGVKIRGTTEENRERFRSVRSLAHFLERELTGGD